MSQNNGPFINTNPTTGVRKALAEEKEELDARQKLLDKQVDPRSAPAGSDRQLPSHQQHIYQGDEAAKQKNFDEKIYLFPESYNALREELETHYNYFFNGINPELGISPAYAMVFDGPQFIGIMNGAFDLTLQVDSDNIDEICKTFLNAARIKRGAKPFAY